MYTIVLTHMYLLATLFMGLVFCWSQKKKAHPFTTTPVQDLKNIDFSASKEDLKPNKDSSNAIEDDLATKWELTPNNQTLAENQNNEAPHLKLPDNIDGKPHKKVHPLIVCLMGIPYKWRIITPFTTNHDYLGWFGRGIVNVTVLFLIWTFSGLIFDAGSHIRMGGLWMISIIVCFVIARLFTFALELIMIKSKYCMINCVKY